jgi:hypothetical protein
LKGNLSLVGSIPSLSATFSNKKEDALGGVPSRPSTRQGLSFAIEDVFKK